MVVANDAVENNSMRSWPTKRPRPTNVRRQGRSVFSSPKATTSTSAAVESTTKSTNPTLFFTKARSHALQVNCTRSAPVGDGAGATLWTRAETAIFATAQNMKTVTRV